MRGWYRAVVDHSLLPARVTLERIMEECVELYCAVPSPGEKTPISVVTSNIDDSIPTEEEFDWAVRTLWGHRSGGPSRMRAGHLREWMREHWAGEGERESEKTTADSDTERRERQAKVRGEDGKEDREREQTKREWVVELVQTSFRDGILSEEATWQAVFLIPKGGG